MKRRAFIVTAAAVAASAVLAACGSSGSSTGDNTGAGSGSSAAGSTDSVASKLIFGGPPEFQTRPDGIPGLKKNYDVTFKSYKSLDSGGPLTVNALKSGSVQAADLFTTDPSIEANNFVVLEDPKNNFAAQNVVPLINQTKATAGVKTALNAVSAKITTDDLSSLLNKVNNDKQDPGQVASDWLAQANLSIASGSASGVKLTVGSANFAENVILANIYAAALKKAGASVTDKFNIGSRETYIPGLKDGSIDLIPEYSGVLLQYLDKGATAVSSDDVYSALQKAVPSPLTVLDKSAAEDKDAVVVTKATADKYNLKSIADLASKS